MIGTKINKTIFDEKRHVDHYFKKNTIDQNLKPEELELTLQMQNLEANEYATEQAKKAWHDYSEMASWCNDNAALIEDKGDYYEVVEAPQPVVTNDMISTQRAARYAIEVDPLTAEYKRKEVLGKFEDGEAEALKAQIEAAVQKIKDELLYL